MAGVHDGRIGEHKQLPADASDQRVEVAARQVGPADRPLEQHVAGEDRPVPHQRHVSGRVPGHVPDFEAETTDAQLVAMGERAVRRRQQWCGDPERRSLLRRRIVQRPVGRVEVDGSPGLLPHAIHAEHVIEVRVGEPDGCRGRTGVPQGAADQLGVLSGIDHGTLSRSLIDHEVGVLDEHAVGDRDDLHRATGACSRKAARYFSTAIAAVVPSPTAVVIWRRTSPAANSPGIEVIIRSSVTKYPLASCLTWPSTIPVLGLNPMNTNTPFTGSCDAAPVTVSSRSRCLTPAPSPTISSTRLFHTISILGFAKARCWRILEARSWSRRCTMYTLLA